MLRSKIIIISSMLIGAVTGCSQHSLTLIETSNLLHESTHETLPSTKVSPWRHETSEIEQCNTEFFVKQNEKYIELKAVEEVNTPVEPSLSSLWQRMRSGFILSDYERPEVQKSIQWFTERPLHMKRLVKQGEPYLYYIVAEIEKRNMPLEIALLPAIESAYQPLAKSHLSAAGLWQFMPATARHYGLRMNWWYDERRDIQASTQAALNYLERLHGIFNDDWLLALAAYNAGQGNVRKALKKNIRKGKATDFWALDLPTETKNYIPKLLALSQIILDPEQYNINLTDINNTRFFSIVKIRDQIDLALVARLSGIPLKQVRRLNPAFERWATTPDGVHDLLLPVDKIEKFKEKLAAIPKEQHVRWVQHKIRSGETLGHIAQKYQINTSLLRQVNHLENSKIRAGTMLMVPMVAQTERVDQKSKKALSEKRRAEHKVVHIVSLGDTLWDLAKAYDVSINKIVDWNNLSKQSILRLGQQVIVWIKPG